MNSNILSCNNITKIAIWTTQEKKRKNTTQNHGARLKRNIQTKLLLLINVKKKSLIIMVCKGHENTLPKSSLRIHIIKIKTVYVKLLLRQLFSVLYNNKLKIQKLMKTFFFIYVHSSLVFVFFASEFSIGISNKDA